MPNRRKKPAEAEPQPANGFAAIRLSSTTLAALEEAGYLEPTPIQAGLIPRALEGADLMGHTPYPDPMSRSKYPMVLRSP